MRKMTKAQRAETTRQMELRFWHCPACEQVFLGAKTRPWGDFGDLGIWARECPTDATRLNPVDDEDVDLSIVDHLAAC